MSRWGCVVNVDAVENDDDDVIRDEDDDDGESKEENPDDRVQMETRSKHVSTLDLNHASRLLRISQPSSGLDHPTPSLLNERSSLENFMGLTRSISPEQRSIVFIVRVRIARGCAAAESRAGGRLDEWHGQVRLLLLLFFLCDQTLGQ